MKQTFIISKKYYCPTIFIIKQYILLTALTAGGMRDAEMATPVKEQE